MKMTDKRRNGNVRLPDRLKNIGKERKGTTLVETMVTLLLISIMMAMAAGALSAAARIFVRIQKEQYAQSILDTTMTELRTITKDASGYVKIYPGGTGFGPGAGGSKSGKFLEFLNPEGYVVLVSTDGCEETEIRIGDSVSGTAEAVPRGRLLTRYYFRNSGTGTYVYIKNGKLVARAVAKVFGDGFYMKNYVEIKYSFPENVRDGDKVNSVTATVTLYRGWNPSNRKYTDEIATDTETLEFRNPLTVKMGSTSVTAISE